MLRHDLRSSHAKTTPIGASKPLRVANTTRTDVFDSLAQQVFCLVIHEVVMAMEERGSCLNIFRTTNHGRILENISNYKAKDMLRKQWRSLDHVLTYFEGQRAVGSQKPSRITRQKTCCASESNTSVRVVFANRSGFDAPIAVVMAMEERGSCLNIFWRTNSGRISETFSNYEAKDLLRKSVDHVLTYSRGQIAVRSQKPSRITRQKTCCASESNTSVRVVFANRSGFDAPIGVVLASEERGSCLNIFRTTNHDRISETFTNYEAKDLLRKELHELRDKRLVVQLSQTRRFALYLRTGVDLMFLFDSSWHGRSVDHVLTYYERQITVGSQKPSRITRQRTCCASESNTSVRVVFANRSGFDDSIGVVLAWEERGSCLNIFQMTNRDQISETFTNYEAKDLLRNESNTSVRVVFANRNGFDAPIGVVLAWEERGSCLNIFQMTNRGRISETFTNYKAKDLLRKSVDHVLTYSGQQIAVGSQKPSQLMRGFDAPIAVVLALEEHGSCLNIFRMTNRCRISETFTNYEAKDLLRKSVDHVLTYSERQIVVGSQKSARNTRQKTCCANEKSRSDLRDLHELGGKRLFAQVSQTRRFALYLRTGVVLILQLELSWHARSVDHVLTYFGRQITVGSEKPSRIMWQKTCCASESNTSVRVVFANRSGFDAPIAVVMAWEDRGLSLNIFRRTYRGRISEIFTN
ncbi:uncharacterized protein G2W53_041599 [Senna tora]|uniref:Uncharacterized protein n=1 Tax=Senna tora TaxID=362788 RepID=A0A834VY51_9FABA|nr:uncharacterized protein G2W53_041599 [Senna tora]